MMSVEKMQEAVGPCPICGRRPWLNDVPIKAFCWGPPDAEHEEMVCIVPSRDLSIKYKWEKGE